MEKTQCCNCGREGEFDNGWYEVDDGDICSNCAIMLDYHPALDD